MGKSKLLRSTDPNGKVEVKADRVERRIYSHCQKEVERIVSLCEKEGLLGDLIVGTSLNFRGEGLVLEHEMVPFVTLPCEWSSFMLRDAALSLLDLIERLSPFELTVSDFHPGNVTYHKGRFVLIDVTALAQGCVEKHFFREFLRHYIHPLILMAKGVWYQASIYLHHQRMCLKYEDIVGYLNPYERAVYHKFLLQVSLARRLNEWRKAIRILRKWVLSYDLTKNCPDWEDYYDLKQLRLVQDSTSWLPKQRVVDQYIESVQPRSVIDIAGNAGLYSFHAALKGITTICFDVESETINHCYAMAKEEGIENLTPAVVDFVAPTLGKHASPITDSGVIIPHCLSFFNRIPSCDLLLVLAVVHHLCFTQHLTFKEIVGQLLRFQSRYLCIEFPTTSYGAVKEWKRKDSIGKFHWYCEDNFISELTSNFLILDRHVLETVSKTGDKNGDRILFLCKRRASATNEIDT